jgi:AcrR family transcriptional regulator
MNRRIISSMSAPTPPRRTQAERTQQRKQQVIREAIHFFGQHGFRGARLADIAEAAGVTEPGLLHHFPSKTHLLMEVLAERDRADREKFLPALRGEKGELLASLQALVEHNQTVPGLVQLFTVLAAESIDPQHPGHSFFVQRYQHLREQAVDILRQGQERGEVRADVRAEDLAVMIFALMDGLQLQWLQQPDEIKMAEVFERFVALLRNNRENQ